MVSPRPGPRASRQPEARPLLATAFLFRHRLLLPTLRTCTASSVNIAPSFSCKHCLLLEVPCSQQVLDWQRPHAGVQPQGRKHPAPRRHGKRGSSLPLNDRPACMPVLRAGGDACVSLTQCGRACAAAPRAGSCYGRSAKDCWYTSLKLAKTPRSWAAGESLQMGAREEHQVSTQHCKSFTWSSTHASAGAAGTSPPTCPTEDAAAAAAATPEKERPEESPGTAPSSAGPAEQQFEAMLHLRHCFSFLVICAWRPPSAWPASLRPSASATCCFSCLFVGWQHAQEMTYAGYAWLVSKSRRWRALGVSDVLSNAPASRPGWRRRCCARCHLATKEVCDASRTGARFAPRAPREAAVRPGGRAGGVGGRSWEVALGPCLLVCLGGSPGVRLAAM